MDTFMSLTGGCQCGAVRYRLDAPPTGHCICHCRMCQKNSGGPFMAFTGVTMNNFKVTRGEISTFVSSDFGERGFCSRCGTPLTYYGTGGDRMAVTLCSLDNPNAVTPDVQVGVESEVSWLSAALTAPRSRADDWLMAARNRRECGSRQHPDHD